MDHLRAILLVGPTGSGKTPLGKYCEEIGVRGNKCAHFDFGDHLRKIADNDVKLPLLTNNDITTVVNSLKTGTLLENENFHIARRLLERFIEETNLRTNDLLLLNGIPRHKGQASDMNGLVRMVMVLKLKCEAEVVCQRIARNSGGDRTGRVDDSIEEIEEKIKIFYERTLPLMDYYRSKGVMVQAIEVDVGMSARDMHKRLEHYCAGL